MSFAIRSRMPTGFLSCSPLVVKWDSSMLSPHTIIPSKNEMLLFAKPRHVALKSQDLTVMTFFIQMNISKREIFLNLLLSERIWKGWRWVGEKLFDTESLVISEGFRSGTNANHAIAFICFHTFSSINVSDSGAISCVGSARSKVSSFSRIFWHNWISFSMKIDSFIPIRSKKFPELNLRQCLVSLLLINFADILQCSLSQLEVGFMQISVFTITRLPNEIFPQSS